MTRLHWVIHNVIAHPLLVICPPLGAWIHDNTTPEVDE